MTNCPTPAGREPRGDNVQESARMARMVLEQLEKDAQRERRWRAGVLTLVALALVIGVMSAPPRTRPRAAAGAYEPAEVSEDAFTEGLDASVLAVGGPLPSKPLPNWKKPPCTPKQREINDACYAKLDQSPGDDHCGEFYEWQGGCYAPIAASRRAPSTLQREQ